MKKLLGLLFLFSLCITASSQVKADIYRQLFSAAYDGNISWMRRIVGQDGLDVNVYNGKACPIHGAVKSGNIFAVKFLMKQGAKIDSLNARGETPLHVAVKRNNGIISKYLVKHGASIHASNHRGETPLHIAAKNGQVKILCFLIHNGADVHAKARFDSTPLSYARNAQVAQALLNHEAKISDKDIDEAVQRAHSDSEEELQLIKLLLKNGADANTRLVWATLLHNAHTAAVAKLLIEYGADVNAENECGETPLHTAKNKDVAQVLIEKGADVNARDMAAYTPLHQTRNAAIAAVLIKNGADVDAATPFEKLTHSEKSTIATVASLSGVAKIPNNVQFDQPTFTPDQTTDNPEVRRVIEGARAKQAAAA